MLGHVHFDRAGMRNERTEILVRSDKISRLVRNKYVRIVNPPGNKGEFLGRIVEGPFFSPEEVRRDSALAQTAILRGEEFPSVPNYYAVGGIEILGELREDRVYGVNTRPAPQAKVYELTDEEVLPLLAISGDMLLGSLDGYEKIDVCLNSQLKAVIPRNIGIFGTVGSGKTNTAQVIIEEAARASYAVIVIDVEGEYLEMDAPSTETRLVKVLKERYGRDAKGISNFRTYYPVAVGSERSDAQAFTLRSCDYEPTVLAEIIDATEPQEGALTEIVNSLQGREAITTPGTEEESLRGLLTASRGSSVPYTLTRLVDEAYERGGKDRQQSTYRALCRKLARLNRSRAFDDSSTDPVNPSNLIQDGLVSVFDVSEANDILKNLVIADLLRKIFAFKLRHPEPKTLLVIEEAHSFISREKIGRMTETLEMIREIARRGRKRWLGLCFISQQPGHLPTEIFELCNTRIVHNVKSLHNLQALKLTAGDVTETMWNNCPMLGAGQAVVSCPQLRDPIVINVRPAETKRKYAEE